MAETKTRKKNTQANEVVESREELLKRIAELEAQLEEAKSKPKGEGRKAQVLALLKKHKKLRVNDIAKAVGISDRNVSSQLSYLRKDGWRIATDSRGYKFIEE